MKYIDLDKGEFTHPQSKKTVKCQISSYNNEDVEFYIDIPGNSELPYQLLGLYGHSTLRNFCTERGVAPMDTSYTYYPYFTRDKIPMVADMLNRELSKKFGGCEMDLSETISLEFE